MPTPSLCLHLLVVSLMVIPLASFNWWPRLARFSLVNNEVFFPFIYEALFGWVYGVCWEC